MVRVAPLLFTLVACVSAAPTAEAEAGGMDFSLDSSPFNNLGRRQSLNYVQNWKSSGGNINYQSTSTGYSVSFSGTGDFVVGRGWNPGSQTKNVTYSGTFQASGGTVLLSLYGWSTNPLVEYYVQEDYQGGSAGQGTHKGTLTSDGATYDVYLHQQVNQPSIQGTSTFNQYISVRSSGSKRSSGDITFANHVAAWKSFGMTLGTMNYQVIATEGWGGASGSSSVTMSGSG